MFDHAPFHGPGSLLGQFNNLQPRPDLDPPEYLLIEQLLLSVDLLRGVANLWGITPQVAEASLALLHFVDEIRLTSEANTWLKGCAWMPWPVSQLLYEAEGELGNWDQSGYVPSRYDDELKHSRQRLMDLSEEERQIRREWCEFERSLGLLRQNRRYYEDQRERGRIFCDPDRVMTRAIERRCRRRTTLRDHRRASVLLA